MEKNYHITGLLCREFIGHRWIPLTKGIDTDVFFDPRLNTRLSKQREAGDLRRHRTHYDVNLL